MPKVYIIGGFTPIKALTGSSVSMKCKGTGQPMPTLEWMKVDGNLSNSSHVSDGWLKIENVSKSDSGRYRCIATNFVGSVISEARLIVEGNLDIKCLN